VTNYGGGNVSELRATDGSLIRTVSTGAGNQPLGIAFDGTNMWVANRGGVVTKIRDSDGTVLGSFTVPTSPYGIAFDGAYLWVSGAYNNIVVRANDGAIVEEWHNDATTGVAFDGAHIWIANLNQNTVTKY